MESMQPPNTQLACDPKKREWDEHCDTICANDPHRCKLEHDKVCRFMCHVVFQEKRMAGKSRPVLSNMEEFERLEAVANGGNHPAPAKPMSTMKWCSWSKLRQIGSEQPMQMRDDAG